MRKLIVLLCLSLWAAPLLAAPGSTSTVISGWVRVASEDTKGQILSVEIVVGEPPAEEPYLVTGAKASELRELIGEWIVASGVVTEDSLGWKSIEVQRFTKIDDLPQPTNPTAPTPPPQP